MKKKITYYFNKAADSYDSAADLQRYIANQLATKLSSYTPTTILEIGCGTGFLSHILISKFTQASVMLVDIASNMVESCRKKFKGNNQITFACLDAETLQDNKKFDLIISSMTIHWFNDIKLGIDNLINQLKPGGVLLFTVPGMNSLTQWRNLCDEYGVQTKQKFPCVEELALYFPNLDLKVENIMLHYPNAFEFLRSLKKLGARASNSNNKSSIKNFIKLLRSAKNEISINYEIMYGCYIKS